MITPTNRPLPDNPQHYQKINIHAPGRIFLFEHFFLQGHLHATIWEVLHFSSLLTPHERLRASPMHLVFWGVRQFRITHSTRHTPGKVGAFHRTNPNSLPTGTAIKLTSSKAARLVLGIWRHSSGFPFPCVRACAQFLHVGTCAVSFGWHIDYTTGLCWGNILYVSARFPTTSSGRLVQKLYIHFPVPFPRAGRDESKVTLSVIARLSVKAAATVSAPCFLLLRSLDI